MNNAISINNVKALHLYESGQLDAIQSLLLFSALLESGLINQIEPHYRETANALIEAGFLEFNGKLTQKCYE